MEGNHEIEMFYERYSRNLSENLSCLFSQNISFLRFRLFFSLRIHIANSIFSVLARIFKILGTDEGVFVFATIKSDQVFFFLFSC